MSFGITCLLQFRIWAFLFELFLGGRLLWLCIVVLLQILNKVLVAEVFEDDVLHLVSIVFLDILEVFSCCQRFLDSRLDLLFRVFNLDMNLLYMLIQHQRLFFHFLVP